MSRRREAKQVRASLAAKRLKALGLAGAILLPLGGAQAQTNGTWIGTAGGNWSTAANWAGGTIPGGGGIATFDDLTGQTGGFTNTVDLATTLSELRINTAWANTYATAAGQSIGMSGAGLTLNVIYGLRSSPTLFFTTVNNISGLITGVGDLVKTGAGTVNLTNTANTFTGTVRINQGTLWVNSGNNATFGNVANNIDINGGILGINTTAITTARNINIGSNGGGLRTFAALTSTGNLTGSGALVKQIGNAAFTYQGDGTGFTGDLFADGGSIVLSSAGGNNGRIGGTGNVFIGSTVDLNNTTANFNDRLGGRNITGRGGALVVRGNATAATSETAGNLTLEQGNSSLQFAPNAAQSTTLTFSGLTRQNNATLVILAPGMGQAPGAGISNVVFTSSPGTLIGGGGDPTTSTIASILPWAYGSTNNTTFNDSTFLTWDATTQRMVPVSITSGFATDITTAAAQDNVNQNVDANLTAATTINSLRMAPAAAVTISGSPLTVTSGAILQTSSASTTPASTISADLTAGSNELILMSTSGNPATGTGLVISGVISGSGGLTRTGGGVVHLQGNNTYTGPTTIAAGITVVPTSTVTGSSPSVFGQDSSPITFLQTAGSSRIWTTGNLVIDRNINVRLGGVFAPGIGTAGLSTAESVTINGNIALSNAIAGSPTSFFALEGGDTLAEAVTINGVVSGNGGLRANFGSYNVLNGNNTYTGGTLLGGTGFQTGTGTAAQQVGETWQVGHNNAFGTGTIWLASQTATASATTQPLIGIGTLIAGGGARTLSNDIVLTTGFVNFAGNNPFTLNGSFELNGSASNGSVVTVGANSPVTINGVVSHGSLIKNGAGTLTLTGNNINSGSLLIRQGVLSVGSIGNGGVAANLGGGLSAPSYLVLTSNSITDTGTLRYTGAGESTNRLFALSGTGGTIDASGTGPLVLTNTGNVQMNTIPGTGGGFTGLTIQPGQAVVALSTFNTAQMIVGSTITNANYPAGTTITEVGPNWIRLSNPSTNTAAATGQTLVIGLPITQRTLTLTGTNTGVNTLTPVLANGGGLNLAVNKTGAGTWSLNGANTYSAGTTINGGTLLANNTTGSATGTGTVTVNSGGTLGGSGSIGGALTVNSGGTVAPGNSPGILTVNNNVTFTSGSNLAIELNGTTVGTGYDQLNVNGTVDLGSSNLLLSLGFAPSVSDLFFVVNNDLTDAITGTFSGLPEGSNVFASFGGNSYMGTITYLADFGTSSLTGGNDVALSGFVAVPEPGSVALLALGAVGLIPVLRRRKK